MSLLTEMQADSPSALWMLDTTADDSSGGTHTLTFGNSPSAVASIIPSVATDARDFNGTTQNAQSSGSSIDVADVFTLEAWFNIDALPGSGVVANLIYKHTAYQLNVYNNGGAGARVWLVRAAVSLLAQGTTAIVADGTLYHAVGTKNGTDIHVYINGTDVTDSVTNSTCVNVDNQVFLASGSSGGEFFNGRIQAAAIYPTALSSARVAAHYAAGTDVGAAPSYFQLYGIS
jgi:hypothetical protein